MSPFLDPLEASNILATAAAEVVERWEVGDLAAAVRRLSDALDHYGKARLATPLPAIRRFAALVAASRPLCSPALTEDAAPASRTLRFEAALGMVDPGAQDPAGLAHGIIAACSEVSREHGLPARDPAVMLIAAQLAWACAIEFDNDLIADLICECFRRSKEARPNA